MLRTNPDVPLLIDEEAELAGEIEVGLVVGCGREEDHLAVVRLDVFSDGTLALAFAVAQVVALIYQDDPEAPQLGQYPLNPTDRGTTRAWNL